MDSDRLWWMLGKDEAEEAHAYLSEAIQALDHDTQGDQQKALRCAKLYDPNATFAGAEYDIRVGPYPVDPTATVLNVVKSMVDTVASMIAKNCPRAAFMTDGANFSTKRRAKNLEKFVEAEFHRTGVYDDAVRMFRDAAIKGSGFLKVFPDNGRVCVERVLPELMRWDPMEVASGGEPRQLHELRYVDKSMLAEFYPKHADYILNEASCTNYTFGRSLDKHQLCVRFSWHLPSGPGAKDGKYAVTIEGRTLEWKRYKLDHFPFVKYDWSEALSGYLGVSLVEELAGIQNRVNRILAHVAKCHGMANTYLLVQAVDAGLKLKASGGPGSLPMQLLPFRGALPPQFVTPALVQPELYQHLQYLVEMAARISGVSERAAQSQKPAGLESAIALQTYADLENQRFSIQAQRYERAILQIARLLVETQKRIGGETVTQYKARNAMQAIKWADVDMDEDMYCMSIEPASLLSRTPSGRFSAAVELGNAGLFERDELRDLIGHPDLERKLSLKNAAENHAEAIIEMLDGGDYRPPEPLDNLPVVFPKVHAAFMLAVDTNAPEEVLDVYRLWLAKGEELLNMQPPPPPPPAPAMPPAPPAPPQLELPPNAIA